MMNEGFTVADALALQNRSNYNGDGMFGGGSWWAIMLFFLLAWGNGGWGGYGNNNGALTRADLCEGFNFNDLQRQAQGIANGICDATYALNNSINNGVSTLGNALSQQTFQMRDGFCETNRNLDALRYETAKQTCEIKENADRNTQRIIDQMTSNTIQELRDKLQYATLTAQNNEQTATLINELRPCSKPAYITQSPYFSVPLNYNSGCGCGNNGYYTFA